MKTLVSLVLVAVLVGASVPAGEVEQGIALYKDGKFAEAEPMLREAEGVEAQAYLAATLQELDRPAEAEPLAKAVLEGQPTHPIAAPALGEALVKQKKLDEAITRMTAVLAAKNDLAYVYYWRGQAYQGQKEIARMVDDYQAFLKLAPDAPEAPAVKALLAGLR